MRKSRIRGPAEAVARRNRGDSPMTKAAPRKMIRVSVKRTIGSVIKEGSNHAKWNFGEMSGEYHGPDAEKNAWDAIRFFEECEKHEKQKTPASGL
jgi:hypothetical protein